MAVQVGAVRSGAQTRYSSYFNPRSPPDLRWRSLTGIKSKDSGWLQGEMRKRAEGPEMATEFDVAGSFRCVIAISPLRPSPSTVQLDLSAMAYSVGLARSFICMIPHGCPLLHWITRDERYGRTASSLTCRLTLQCVPYTDSNINVTSPIERTIHLPLIWSC